MASMLAMLDSHATSVAPEHLAKTTSKKASRAQTEINVEPDETKPCKVSKNTISIASKHVAKTRNCQRDVCGKKDSSPDPGTPSKNRFGARIKPAKRKGGWY